MSQFFIAINSWLHELATVIFIGHYLLLSLLYLPVLAKEEPIVTAGTILSKISKRSRIWLYVSLIVFIVTGIFLMLADPNYLGLANLGNLWGILMLFKHILVLGMIAIGFWYNAILRVGPLMSSNTGASQTIGRFRFYSNLMAVCGVLVLLLTVIAQVE